MLASPVWVVLVGALAGLLPGVFGFGGGWLLVPILVMCLGVSWGYASGTVLCAILAGATSGAVSLFLEGGGKLRDAETPGERGVIAVMVAAVLVGTALGKAALRDRLEGLESATVVLDVVLIVVLGVIAARLLYEVVVGYERGAPRRPDAAHLMGVAAATLATGALSGLIGIGGGVLYVPILMLVLHWRVDEARAVSRLVVLGSALTGAGLYGWSGSVHFPTAAGMFVPAGVVGVAASGVRFGHSEERRRTFKILASLMSLAAIVLAVMDMARGHGVARAEEWGGAGAAALAVCVPLGWGALCALGRRVVLGRGRPSGSDAPSAAHSDEP